MEDERAECLNRILGSESPRKVIVAGAGTGKTYTFSELLKQISGNCLAITFLNALANDMAEELAEVADARTFHSLCRMLLHQTPGDGITTDFHLYPKLEQIVVLDALAAGNVEASSRGYFQHAFQALIEDDGRIDYFLSRADYYNAVGFDDSVYRVLRLFRLSSEYIPQFEQLVVDEYQDFNPLEVEFIDHLATKSPIMIVGDDDQAIYDFKAASPEHLREKANDSDFERLELPYCSRCTSVIVDACSAALAKATELGHLQGRIDKKYLCYLPDKEADNERYPKILKVQCSVNMKNAPYIARYIEQTIQSIPEEETNAAIEGRYPIALIIGPSHYLRQIHAYLADRFENVIYKPRQNPELAAIDGYKLLLQDADSNLGWRIVSWIDEPAQSDAAVIKADDDGTLLVSQLDDETVQKHLAVTELLRKLRNGDEVGRDGVEAVENCIGKRIDEILAELGTKDEDEADAVEDSTKAAVDHPEIWLTTYNGCKGMSAGFTFVVGLENNVLPRNQDDITDNEIRQFVVALTRTRKQCHLISTGRFGAQRLQPSVLLEWIPDALVESVRVNKSYFTK